MLSLLGTPVVLGVILRDGPRDKPLDRDGHPSPPIVAGLLGPPSPPREALGTIGCDAEGFAKVGVGQKPRFHGRPPVIREGIPGAIP